jgi:hypothetical protein
VVALPTLFVLRSSLQSNFSLRLARALPRAHYFYYFSFFKLDLSDFLDIHLLEYATDSVKSYTIVMAETCNFE